MTLPAPGFGSICVNLHGNVFLKLGCTQRAKYVASIFLKSVSGWTKIKKLRSGCRVLAGSLKSELFKACLVSMTTSKMQDVAKQRILTSSLCSQTAVLYLQISLSEVKIYHQNLVFLLAASVYN